MYYVAHVSMRDIANTRNLSGMVKTRAKSQQASLENCLGFLDKPRASSGFNAGW
jgi:hypothetical protein